MNTGEIQMIRVYFAVRTDGAGGYLNADGMCVDRGHVCNTDPAHAEAAALACIFRPYPRLRRGQVRVQRTVEVRSTLTPV
jgi:hypothetical protein